MPLNLKYLLILCQLKDRQRKDQNLKTQFHKKKIWFTEISDTHEISTEPSLKIKLITCFEFDCRRKTFVPFSFISFQTFNFLPTTKGWTMPFHSLLSNKSENVAMTLCFLPLFKQKENFIALCFLLKSLIFDFRSEYNAKFC